jgi:[NiFe] hydrogenase diaphorase moiety small subunit
MSKQLYIDGQAVPFEEGQTIMDAALAAGIYIPHLCHNPEFTPYGNCRLCTVRINGRYAAACVTPAQLDAQVENNTGELKQQRQLLLQMLFVEGNHQCPACEKSGACQLQAVAYYCGMLAPALSHFYPRLTLDASHPSMLIDFNRCILCALCVRASEQVDGKQVFSISGRGPNAHLRVNSATGKLADTDFSATDRAAHVCPTGAILHKHKGYEIPIGERFYDQQPVSLVGDISSRGEDEN